MANVRIGQVVWVVVPGDRFSGKVESVGADEVRVDDGVGTTWVVSGSGSAGAWLESGRGEVVYGNAEKGAAAHAASVREAQQVQGDEWVREW